jgi:PAS domain-containing protein
VMEGAVVCDAAGRPVQLLGVTRDITEGKHVEAQLLESERALRDLLGALPAAIYVTDATVASRIVMTQQSIFGEQVPSWESIDGLTSPASITSVARRWR